MKSLKIVLFLCMVFLCTQAHFLEDLYKKTHFKGKVGLNTSKGLDLDYKGGLEYDGDLIKLDLLKVGAKFNAVPQDSVGDATSKSISYSGSVDFIQGDKDAHVAASGTAGYQGNVNVNGSQVAYSKQVVNNNTWNATSGEYFISGNHSGSGSVQGTLDYSNGSNIRHQQQMQGQASVNGKAVFNNGTAVGDFAISKAGSASIDKNVTMLNNDTSNPKYNFQGRGTFNKQDGLTWNNDTWADTKQGQVAFAGLGWGSYQNDGNNTQIRHTVKQNVNFLYGETLQMNGNTVATGVTNGSASVQKGFRYNGYANGTKNVVSSHSGNMTQHTEGSMKDEDSKVSVELMDNNNQNTGEKFLTNEFKVLTQESLEKMYDESLFQHPFPEKYKDGYQSDVQANWNWNGSMASNPVSDSNTTTVTAKSITSWDAMGNNTINGSWEKHGNRTSDGGWIVVDTGNSTKIEDVHFSTNNEGNFFKKLESVAEHLQKLFNQFRGL